MRGIGADLGLQEWSLAIVDGGDKTEGDPPGNCEDGGGRGGSSLLMADWGARAAEDGGVH